MRKLFTFLLALAASVGMMNAKVTWDSSNISDLNISGTGSSYSKEGVTLSANANDIAAWWWGYDEESLNGITFSAFATGGYTFSNTLDKNFTKIEMFPVSLAGWNNPGVNLGSGWSFSEENGDIVTWNGNASTVDLLKDVSIFNGQNVKSIVFYFEDANPSGSCGENLTWEFDPSTGALTISGTGAMDNYSWDPNAAPWYAYKDAITSVSFPEGITTIGAYAFVNCDNAAFTTVTIPEGVTALGVNAFYNCDGIQEITIPSTVTTMEAGAIYDCKAVNSITSYIASPTNLHGYAIYGYKNTCTLYVPYASIAAYQEADCWKYIPNIAAIPGTEPAPAPTVYNSGSVALSNLKVGDILMAGVTLTDDSGSKVKFVPSRLKIIAIRDSEFTVANFVNSLQTPLLGENAAMTFPGGLTITPINEEREDGNAWVVTEINVAEDTPVALAGITYSGTTPATSDEHITANEDPKNTGVYYSTFYDSENKYALPAGVEAYVAEVSSNALNLTKIAGEGQIIPANNAVILKSSVDQFTLSISNAAAVSFTTTNNLHGVDADTEIATVVTGTCYVLSGNNTDGVGFFVYKAPNQLQAHKAYIDLNGSGMAQAPRRMPFVFNGEQTATGVENVQGNVQSTKVIENGVLYIIKNGVKYNAMGQIVK